MTTTQPAATAAGAHPFTAALAARDIDALVDALAADIVVYSAVTSVPFEGRDTVRDLYESLFEAFEELRIVDRFESADTHAFFWEGRIDGRYVAGADRLRLNAAGKVREITIVGRPLSGLATFISGIGYQFARRRRGGLVARLLRLTALPLPRLFAALEPLIRWISRGRGTAR
jgi:ketosteroid isomerase-like protein